MLGFFRGVLHPDRYHGRGKEPPFFEGWYYKVVDANEALRYAIIPGVFLSHDPERQHAFVQVLDGRTGQSAYHRYPTGAFWAAKDDFEVRIGPNRFTACDLSLDLQGTELPMKGTLHFRSLNPWPVRLTSPGIMGWYAWVPFMETYHGVVSLDHGIEGSLKIAGQEVDFSGGRGYTEKDWGRSFPSAYVWFQSNHFGRPDISLSASVAIIPWIGRSFPGFIVGLLYNGRLYRFATYSGAEIDNLHISDEEVGWSVSDRRYRLEMRARRTRGGLLQAPTASDMERRVAETLDARVEVRLYERQDGLRPIFEGMGRHGGLEASGDLERLVQMWRDT
ncbi:MAG: tocopherol cyclase family protein [Anaerolineae bacterium]|nr:tocopherol cyclase family protein [Anaerolineae bacterium]